MKTIYKCKVCGAKRVVSEEEMGFNPSFCEKDKFRMEERGFIMLLGTVDSDIHVPLQILAQCDGHYGVHDAVGFEFDTSQGEE